MKNSKLLIIFLITIISGVFFLFHFSSTNFVPTDTMPINEKFTGDNYPEVSLVDQSCDIDDDCAIVTTECSCDCGTSINKAHLQKYRDIREQKCENYMGIVCGMDCSGSILKCVDNKCVQEKKIISNQ